MTRIGIAESMHAHRLHCRYFILFFLKVDGSLRGCTNFGTWSGTQLCTTSSKWSVPLSRNNLLELSTDKRLELVACPRTARWVKSPAFEILLCSSILCRHWVNLSSELDTKAIDVFCRSSSQEPPNSISVTGFQTITTIRE